MSSTGLVGGSGSAGGDGVQSNQLQLVAVDGTQVLGIVHSSLNNGHIAAQVNGSGRGQVSALGSVAGLRNSTGLQFRHGLAHSEIAQSSNLGIPLSDGATPGNHAVVFALLVLGIDDGSQIGGDHAVGAKVDGSGNAVDLAGTDDTVIVHGNSSNGNVVCSGAGCLSSSGNAVRDLGGNSQAGLQSGLAIAHAGLSRFSGGVYGVAFGGAGAVANDNHSAGAASQHGHDQDSRDQQQKLVLHKKSSNIYLLISESTETIALGNTRRTPAQAPPVIRPVNTATISR